MSNNMGNFRAPPPPEPRITAGGSSIMQTPFGNVVTGQPISSMPPPLPPPIGPNRYSSPGMFSQPYGGMGPFSGMGSFMGYGSGFAPYGGGYGYYGNSFASSYGGYQNDPESQFVRLAEESSRPAFQSIQSFVSAIANIASLLDSTFFAITSSFRAILGVAANFGRLRGVFAQFWTTFAVFRWLNWIYRKILHALKLSNIDPATIAFKEAFAVAQGAPSPSGKASPWPVLAFITFMMTAPYIMMKLVRTVTNTAREDSKNPRSWVQPIPCRALYDFQATNPGELSMQAGQQIWIAPKGVQKNQQLLNSGWAIASIDGITSGLVPIAYVKSPYQTKPNFNSPSMPDAPQPVTTPETQIPTTTESLGDKSSVHKMDTHVPVHLPSEKKRDKSPEKIHPVCNLPPIPEINETLST